jgi:hypothetical protein
MYGPQSGRKEGIKGRMDFVWMMDGWMDGWKYPVFYTGSYLDGLNNAFNFSPNRSNTYPRGRERKANTNSK